MCGNIKNKYLTQSHYLFDKKKPTKNVIIVPLRLLFPHFCFQSTSHEGIVSGDFFLLFCPRMSLKASRPLLRPLQSLHQSKGVHALESVRIASQYSIVLQWKHSVCKVSSGQSGLPSAVLLKNKYLPILLREANTVKENSKSQIYERKCTIM